MHHDYTWINGETIASSDARISIEDRGFQFADGVYEVFRVYRGKVFTMDEHLQRLQRSAAAIQIALPLSTAALAEEIRKLTAETAVGEGMVYLQLTRGVAPRNHVFPKDARPTLLVYTRQLPPIAPPGGGEGVKLCPVQDLRWKCCYIKSLALLPNVLAKNEAVSKGFDEAVFVDNGIITECAASNVYAIINRKLVTHPAGSKVLPGITRQVLLELAPQLNIEVDERPLREEETLRADELFITSTTREISWVARYGDRYIGQGRCGSITEKLHRALRDRIERDTR